MRRLGIAVIAFSLLMTDTAVTADEVARELLTTAWSRKYAARKTADGIYRRAITTTPTAQRAYLIVLVHQRRYREALPLAGRLAATDDSGQSRAAQVWVAAVMRKYSQSLLAMQQLSKQFHRLPQAGQPSMARFLGSMMGFLDGPVAYKLPVVKRDAGRRDIESNLGPLAREFQQARLNVLNQFINMESDHARAVTAGKVQEGKLRAQLRQDLKQIRQRNDEAQTRLDDQRQKTDRSFQQQSSKLERADEPLRREQDQVNDAAFGAELERRSIQRDLWWTWDRANRNRVRRRGSWQTGWQYERASWLQYDLERNFYDRARLSRRANRIAWDRYRLAWEGAALRQRYSSEVRQTAKAQKKLERRRRRTDYEERRLNRPNRGHTSRSHAIKRRMKTLATFVTLPLEKQRTELLAKQ